MLGRKDKVVVIGDLHFPYVDRPALKWALRIIKQEKPTHVVQIGDIYDCYWFSKYPKKFIKLNPDQEVTKARRMAKEFWHLVQENSPKARCYQILGNHDDRPMKRVAELMPELSSFFTFKNLYEFHNVNTNLDSRLEVELKINGEKILFHHGHRSQLGAHMRFYQQSTVVGHSHRGGVVYQKLDKRVIYEMNCGFLGDQNAGPLQYGPQARKNWTLGLGIIDSLGPRFVPYK